MLRRSMFSLALAVMLALAVALPALAGGVVVTLDGSPSGVDAGVPFTFGFTVFSAHDGSPESGLHPIVTARNSATGERVVVTAQPDGAAGHYAATLTLPSDGAWEWEIQPFGEFVDDYPASVMTPITVSAPAVQPALTESAGQITPQAEPLPALSLALAAIALVGGVAALSALAITRARRRAAVRS